jgi:photosystem II stability/assembly factor-like uncharacterized protein
MKQFLYGSLFLLFVLVLAGCDLITNSTAPTQPQIGNDLMITEVFTISPARYYAYSWIELYNPTGRSVYWSDINRPVHALVVGGNGVIFDTPEDGRVWSSRPTNTNATLRGLAFEYPDTGHAVGENGTVVKSTDAGATWQPYTVVFNDPSAAPLTVNLNAIEAPSVQIVIGSKQLWLAGDKGTIVRSTNKGQTWDYQTTNTKQNINCIFSRSSAQNLFATGDSGTVLMTTNGGIAWSLQNVSRKVNIYGFSLLSSSAAANNNDSIWVCGGEGLVFHSFATRKAALDWRLETTPVKVTLRAIHFPINSTSLGAVGEFNGSGNGWAVGDQGTIIHTPDYGATWKVQKSHTLEQLNAVRFVDSLHGFAFGNNGVILNTSDGGRNWTQQSSGTSQNLYATYFFPLTHEVTNYYVLQMKAQRKYYYQGSKINYNYYTKIDTGTAYYIPYDLYSSDDIKDKVITPGAFAVITSDTGAFNDHTKLGPGSTQVPRATTIQSYPWAPQTYSFGGFDTTFFIMDIKWNLLSSGEIRFLKFHDEFKNANGYTYVSSHDSTIIDIVRYGNYVAPDNSYPNDKSAPPIPEWSSLARYQDDYGFTDPTKFNTAYSFYITGDPIPGWGSQLRRGK